MVITRSAVSATANGGPNGTTNTGDNPVGGAANGANTGGSSTAGTSADAVFTVRPGAQCLPVLSVTKTTLTPTVTTAAATSVSYTIVVSNSGGAAIGADLVDNALPPGWTLSQTSGIAFAPALSASAWGGFVEGATPGLPGCVNALLAAEAELRRLPIYAYPPGTSRLIVMLCDVLAAAREQSQP